MQDLGSRKDKYCFHNYLTSLVKALENKHTVIDLRNESCVSGLIKHVDGKMNVEMESAVFYDAHGTEHRFRDFFISARTIRYVHIPEGESSIDLIKMQLSRLTRSKVRVPKQRTFKSVRAERYNREILHSAYEAQPGPSGT